VNTNKIEMRIANFIVILFFITCVSSCDIAVDPDGDLKKINCDSLKTGIVNMDSRIVKYEVNKLVADLKTKRTSDDFIGQKENLAQLINRLVASCDDMNVGLICYACIETNPSQSEILIKTDSVGTPIKSVMDISTPTDSNLKCLGIHGYTGG